MVDFLLVRRNVLANSHGINPRWKEKSPHEAGRAIQSGIYSLDRCEPLFAMPVIQLVVQLVRLRYQVLKRPAQILEHCWIKVAEINNSQRGGACQGPDRAQSPAKPFLFSI